MGLEIEPGGGKYTVWVVEISRSDRELSREVFQAALSHACDSSERIILKLIALLALPASAAADGNSVHIDNAKEQEGELLRTILVPLQKIAESRDVEAHIHISWTHSLERGLCDAVAMFLATRLYIGLKNKIFSNTSAVADFCRSNLPPTCQLCVIPSASQRPSHRDLLLPLGTVSSSSTSPNETPPFSPCNDRPLLPSASLLHSLFPHAHDPGSSSSIPHPLSRSSSVGISRQSSAEPSAVERAAAAAIAAATGGGVGVGGGGLRAMQHSLSSSSSNLNGPISPEAEGAPVIYDSRGNGFIPPGVIASSLAAESTLLSRSASGPPADGGFLPDSGRFAQSPPFPADSAAAFMQPPPSPLLFSAAGRGGTPAAAAGGFGGGEYGMPRAVPAGTSGRSLTTGVLLRQQGGAAAAAAAGGGYAQDRGGLMRSASETANLMQGAGGGGLGSMGGPMSGGMMMIGGAAAGSHAMPMRHSRFSTEPAAAAAVTGAIAGGAGMVALGGGGGGHVMSSFYPPAHAQQLASFPKSGSLPNPLQGQGPTASGSLAGAPAIATASSPAISAPASPARSPPPPPISEDQVFMQPIVTAGGPWPDDVSGHMMTSAAGMGAGAGSGSSTAQQQQQQQQQLQQQQQQHHQIAAVAAAMMSMMPMPGGMPGGLPPGMQGTLGPGGGMPAAMSGGGMPFDFGTLVMELQRLQGAALAAQAAVEKADEDARQAREESRRAVEEAQLEAQKRVVAEMEKERVLKQVEEEGRRAAELLAEAEAAKRAAEAAAAEAQAKIAVARAEFEQTKEGGLGRENPATRGGGGGGERDDDHGRGQKGGGMGEKEKVGNGWHLEEFREYRMEELREACDNFADANLMGEGTYGVVYRGVLEHVPVAVKCLKSCNSNEGMEEFRKEIEVQRGLRHPTIVLLIGYCPAPPCLVYELMPNGSVYDRLICRGGTPPLPWHTRFRILEDTCKALIHLHNRTPAIVHLDLKPANVLLDANFNAKLGDVGLARFMVGMDGQHSFVQQSVAVGTLGYVDPHFLRTGQVSLESDIFSLGMLMLDLLAGIDRSAAMKGGPQQGQQQPVQGLVDRSGLLEVLEQAEQNDEELVGFLDHAAGQWPRPVATTLLRLSRLCTSFKRKERPNLSREVMAVLAALRPIIEEAVEREKREEMEGMVGGMVREMELPNEFRCPITLDVMENPVIAADGHTYERRAIEQWLSKHNFSPTTGARLSSAHLTPNLSLESMIKDWLQSHSRKASARRRIFVGNGNMK